DAAGCAILCAPVRRGAVAWDRCLVGRVLPLVAGLHGREPLHAAAVVGGGRALAIVAPSGGGESTLAALLVATGWTFLSDDVGAVDAAREGPATAFPGPAVAALRGEGPLGGDLGAALGTSLAADALGTRVLVRARAAAAPLRDVCFVRL